MNVSRRNFMIGAASVVAIVTAPPILKMLVVPTLYADGIHDDTDALSSLLSGGKAQSPTGIIFEQPVIYGGKYLIEGPVNVRMAEASLFDAEFILADNGGIKVHDPSTVTFMGCTFTVGEPGRLDLDRALGEIKISGMVLGNG